MMDSVKNRGRNKLFMCFRPVAINDNSLKPDRKDGLGDPAFTYISVRGKEKMVLPKILKSLSEEKFKVSSDGGDAGGCRRRKERSNRSFSRILKAVLFETSLAKKIFSRKDRRYPSKSNSVSAKAKKVSDPLVNEKPKQRESSEADDRGMNSNRWSSPNSSSSITASTSLCSSCASSICSRSLSGRKSSFRANSSESKQVDRPIATKKVGERFNSNIGLCLLLMCLLVLIFWGRVCAIFCTSTFLCLVPSRITRVGSPVNAVDLLEMDWEEHKKRVIMEGLLERNRSRVL